MPTFTYVSVDSVTPSSGPTFGGQAVTIKGFGFDLATGVTFGGDAATSVVIVSNTTITAVTPVHASGAVDVTVGNVDTLTDGYTYGIGQALLPPIPYLSPMLAEQGRVSNPYFLWLTTLKQRVESMPGQVAAESVIGVLSVANIPELPFTKIELDNSPRLLGRTSDGAGASEEIRVAGGLVLSGGILSIAGLPGGYVVGDILYADSNHSLARLADVSVGSYLRSGGVATAPLWSTLKLPNAATVGDIPIATTTDTLTMLADVAAGSYLRSGGVATAPLWSTLILPNAVTAGSVVFASATNTYGQDNANLFWDDGNNRLGLGTTGPNATLGVAGRALIGNVDTGGVLGVFASATTPVAVIQGNSLASGDTFLSIAAGSVTAGDTYAVNASVNNSSGNAFFHIQQNGTGGHAVMSMLVGAATTGDPRALFAINGGQAWSIGLDNSDADCFKISASSGLGTNDALSISTALNVAIGTSLFPSTGTFSLIFADGTAPATMGSNTAAIYADDVAGTVKMFVISEDGVTGQIATVGGSGSGAALTRVDDTNVTLTLGGTPTTALLAATSLTLGWTGTLGVTRGGTGTGTAFTAGSVVFAGASGVYGQDNGNLFWDDGNDRLGIGTASPSAALHISISSNTLPTAIYERDVNTNTAVNRWTTGGTSDWNIGLRATGDSNFHIFSFGITADAMTFERSSGNVAIGTTVFPSTGTATLVFGDGTVPATMGSNTAAIYANDTGGTVNMYGINEAGTVTQLTGLTAAYTITNVTTDRTYDANATDINEIADVLGTLIADLQARGICG